MAVQTHFHDGPADYPVPDWQGYSIRAVHPGAQPFPPAPADIKSILIIKLDAMGDYLLHTPFYAHLRRFYPHAKISCLCSRAVQDLALHNPDFNHVIAAPHAPGYNQTEAFLFGMALQQHEAALFDLVIVPRWYEDWHHAGVIAQTVDAPYRLCYAANVQAYKAQNFPQHDGYFTHVIEDPRPAHEVWRGMQILHALGMDLPPISGIRQHAHTTPEDAKKAQDILAGTACPRPWIGLGIGASVPFKTWPVEHFSVLAQNIVLSMGGTVFLLGGGVRDTEAAAEILRANPTGIVNGVGQLSVRESICFIAQCDAVVCSDSFAMHAAATQKVPVVEVVGQPADGDRNSEYLPWCFGPWGVPFAWLQPTTCAGSGRIIPDFRNDAKCIADVPPDAVYLALQEMLRQWPKRD